MGKRRQEPDVGRSFDYCEGDVDMNLWQDPVPRVAALLPSEQLPMDGARGTAFLLPPGAVVRQSERTGRQNTDMNVVAAVKKIHLRAVSPYLRIFLLVWDGMDQQVACVCGLVMTIAAPHPTQTVCGWSWGWRCEQLYWLVTA
jgi:hypothetical protein